MAADGNGVPSWLLQLGEILVPLGGLLGFVVNRHDRAIEISGREHLAAMEAIDQQRVELDAHKAEMAAAIERERARTDQRHEYLRRELTNQVEHVGQRMAAIGERMVTREDFNQLSGRIDRVLERVAEKPL